MEPQDTPPEQPPKPQFSSSSQTPTTPKPQDEAFESAGQSTADYIKSLEPVKKQQKKRRTKRIIFTMVPLVIVLAAGAYFFIAKPKKTHAPEPAATEHTDHMAAEESVDTQLGEHYVSQSLRMTVDYPKSWTKNDETTGQLTLQSPMNVKLTDAAGTKMDGQVTITIASTGKPVPNFTGTMATAAAESIKMPYAQPASTQRKETYLSFLSFGTSTGVDAVYITGDYGYQKAQDVSKTDVAKIDPMVSVSFKACEGGTCDKPLSISTEAWASDEILKVTQSVLQSFVFQ